MCYCYYCYSCCCCCYCCWCCAECRSSTNTWIYLSVSIGVVISILALCARCLYGVLSPSLSPCKCVGYAWSDIQTDEVQMGTGPVQTNLQPKSTNLASLAWVLFTRTCNCIYPCTCTKIARININCNFILSSTHLHNHRYYLYSQPHLLCATPLVS